MRDLLRKDLIRDEGTIPYAYKDHLGYWTCGYGFLIDKEKGGHIPKAVMDFWLDHKLDEIEAALDKELPWWKTRTAGAQRAMVEMAYQLGVAGLMDFKKALACLQAGDYAGARTHALDSKWAKLDTPDRADRVTALFLEKEPTHE